MWGTPILSERTVTLDNNQIPISTAINGGEATAKLVRTLVIATAFSLDDSHYPNVRMRNRRQVYWQNIAVMMATARRFAPAPAELIVFSTDQPTEDVAPLLHRVGVTVVNTPFSYRPPTNFYYAFNGAFYLFDAMEWCVQHRGTECDFLFLDPDCVLTGDISPMRDVLRDHDVIGYELPWRHDWDNSGLSPEALRLVAEELSGCSGMAAPKQYGGEILAFSGAALRRLTTALPEVWQTNLNRFHQGKLKFNTEEHFISYLLWRDTPRIYDAKDRFVKRFWTGVRYRNFQEGDERLAVWHLPGEKSRGIPRLFRDLSRQRVRLETMSEADAKTYMASVVGLRGAWLREALFRILVAAGRSLAGVP